MPEQLVDTDGRRRLGPGELLCKARQRLDAVYQVRSGRLSVFVDGPDGELRIGELTSPAFIGEISALTGGLTTATVRADVDTELAELPVVEYAAWIADRPEAAEQVAAMARDRSNRSRAAALIAELTSIGDGAAIDRVMDLVDFTAIEADEVLFRQGDEADAAYIVVTGRVRVQGEADEDGRGAVDVELGRGAIVGELGLIEDRPRNASVRAVRDTTLARIDRDRFEELAARHPSSVVRVIRTILQRAWGGTPPVSRARSVAVAVTSPSGPVPDFQERFGAEIERHGGLIRFSADVVESALGRTGAAFATAGTLEQQRLSELLHEAEAGTDYLELEIGPDLDAWTRRALRYTDRLLILTSDQPDATERARIEALVDAADAIPGIEIWIVTQYPADHPQPTGAATHLADPRIHDVRPIRPDLAADVERLARLCTGNGVGVVFGGGGARGFAHIGAIQALEEAGVPIDAVAGTSMGAVFVGVRAADMDTSTLVAAADEHFHKSLDYTLPVVAMTRGARIDERFNRFYGDWRLEDGWVPGVCVSTNLSTADVRVHRHGRIAMVVRASAAIPGAMPPVAMDGDLLVDGGVLDNLPVDLLADDDRVGTVIALDPASEEALEPHPDYESEVSGFRALRALVDPRKDAYPGMAGIVIRSLLVASSRRRDEVLASGKIDLYIPLDLPEIGLMDFSAAGRAAVAGREIAAPLIAKWLAD